MVEVFNDVIHAMKVHEQSTNHMSVLRYVCIYLFLVVFLDGYKIGADSSNMKVLDWDRNTQIRLRFWDIAG